MISKFDIICISTSIWEYPWGSRQQIMSRLAVDNRILFVEPQISVLHLLKYPWLVKRTFLPTLRRVAGNIIVYRPWFNLPFGNYSKTINFLNQQFLLLQLRRLIKRFKFLNILLWIFEPNSCFLLERLKERVSIYHAIDFFKKEKNICLRRKCIEAMEEKLCRKCGILLTSTTELLQDKRNLNKDIHLIPSAVSESFFNNGPAPLPRDMENIPRPRIGFTGTIDNRIDFELLDFVLAQNHNWQIVLIGIVRTNKIFKYVESRKEIHLLDWKDNSILPAYINAFDVCILPYKINEFTKGISPIKIFEYLALGKPVVAVDLPSLRNLSEDNFIKSAKTRKEFYDYIAGYLTNDAQDTKDRRIEFAKKNTWRNRIEIVSKVINNHIASQKLRNED